MTILGPPFGDAKSIDDAKARFKSPWLAFNEKHGPEKLAQAYEAMNHANSLSGVKRARSLSQREEESERWCT